jgi:hypothetical protein
MGGGVIMPPFMSICGSSPCTARLSESLISRVTVWKQLHLNQRFAKFIVAQLIKEFTNFHGTQNFAAICTEAVQYIPQIHILFIQDSL